MERNFYFVDDSECGIDGSTILFHLYSAISDIRISIHVSFSAPNKKNNNFEKYRVMIRKNKKSFVFFVST